MSPAAKRGPRSIGGFHRQATGRLINVPFGLKPAIAFTPPKDSFEANLSGTTFDVRGLEMPRIPYCATKRDARKGDTPSSKDKRELRPLLAIFFASDFIERNVSQN